METKYENISYLNTFKKLPNTLRYDKKVIKCISKCNYFIISSAMTTDDGSEEFYIPKPRERNYYIQKLENRLQRVRSAGFLRGQRARTKRELEKLYKIERLQEEKDRRSAEENVLEKRRDLEKIQKRALKCDSDHLPANFEQLSISDEDPTSNQRPHTVQPVISELNSMTLLFESDIEQNSKLRY